MQEAGQIRSPRGILTVAYVAAQLPDSIGVDAKAAALSEDVVHHRDVRLLVQMVAQHRRLRARP
eukprot:scaffold8656_cov69-Phaeocystis_antarctica.AAC.3